MAHYKKRPKVKRYRRSFYSREMKLKKGIGIVVLVLAVLLVTEARHRLRSKAIPKAFRGLPITLVYIGVLALAIYGITGHSVIL